MTTYEIKIPGASFEESLMRMKADLVEAATRKQAVSFSLFFDYFSLTASNSSLKDKLLARGSFVPAGSNATFRNSGPIIDHTIADLGPEKRTLTLFVSPTVIVNWSLNVSRLDLAFSDGNVMLGVDQMPPELGFGTSFILTSISWDETGVKYYAVEDGVPDHTVVLFVDVSLTDGAFLKSRLRAQPPSGRMRLLARSMALDSNCCGGFKAKDPPAPTGPLCVDLHAKVLIQPAFGIADQVNAMNEIYKAADITVRLRSTEQLNLPQFLDLDVGQCVSGSVTAEQSALYRYRNNAAAQDICAYWVDSMTSATGSTIGCAAYPPGVPALSVVRSTGTIYVLAHEVAHVLGLFHVDISDRLNLMRPVDAFDDPPPDLTAAQRDRMRWSQWLKAC
jgi:hypothetical protein